VGRRARGKNFAMITQQFAARFAADWIDAWNAMI
jgi:hypothetical protein